MRHFTMNVMHEVHALVSLPWCSAMEPISVAVFFCPIHIRTPTWMLHRKRFGPSNIDRDQHFLNGVPTHFLPHLCHQTARPVSCLHLWRGLATQPFAWMTGKTQRRICFNFAQKVWQSRSPLQQCDILVASQIL